MAIKTTKDVVGIWNRALHRIGSTKLVQNIDEKTAEAEACRLHYGDWLIAALEMVRWPFATKQVQLNVAIGEWVSTTAYAAGDTARYNGSVYEAVQATTGDNPESDDGTNWSYSYGLGVGWDYAYSLPSDFVNFIAFITSAGARSDDYPPSDFPFDIVANGDGSSNVLVTNMSPNTFNVMEYTGIPGGRDTNTGEVNENPVLYTRQFIDAVAYGLAVDLALAIKKDVSLSDKMMARFSQSLQTARSTARNNVNERPEPVTPSVAMREF